ncbi:MAG: GTPase Era [Candidatus Omnitrophica bacterium]|nr:GTPase Era [Candidatus Omnitrophota bacterium]
MYRLKLKMENEQFKSGFITILGRPNVGKSTLLNAVLGQKISIVSPIPQTTRFQLKGILNQQNSQIVFVDTPGIHLFKEKFAYHLNKVSLASLVEIDLILYVVDVSRPPGQEEKKIIDIVARQKSKVVMVLNKSDLGRKYLNDYIELWQEKIENIQVQDPLIYYIPVSAKIGKNIEKLKNVLLELTPEGYPFYDKDTSTDFPDKYRAADIIREKLFLKTKQEIPHSVAVAVKEIQEKERSVYILAHIYIQRSSQKKIIIGKDGGLLKEVGTEARSDLENIYKKKIYLDLWVKIEKEWQNNSRILQDLGYWIK